jgi:hypothetical protein
LTHKRRFEAGPAGTSLTIDKHPAVPNGSDSHETCSVIDSEEDPVVADANSITISRLQFFDSMPERIVPQRSQGCRNSLPRLRRKSS